jgi:hypothetical protein
MNDHENERSNGSVLCLARPPSILPAPVRSDRVVVNGGLTQVEFSLRSCDARATRAARPQVFRHARRQIILDPRAGRVRTAGQRTRRRHSPWRWLAIQRIDRKHAFERLIERQRNQALGPQIIGNQIVLVHFPMAFFFSNPHGGWQFSAFWPIARVGQALPARVRSHRRWAERA